MIPVAIIGAGPAGIAAAIQLKRLGRDFALFERSRVGGLLVNAHLVENYPGFPDGIPGPDLVGLMAAQLARHSVNVRFEEVLLADASDDHFIIKTPRESLAARALVIASGTLPRDLESPRIPVDLGGRILHEVAPIRDIEGRRIAILGAGDAAFDYALTLERRNAVVILNRGESPRCIPILAERATTSKNVEHMPQTRLAEIGRGPNGIKLACLGPAGAFDLDADYLLLAIGRRPELSFLAPPLAAVAQEPSRRWPLFFVGDVGCGRARQTARAVGDGVDAAMQIHTQLPEIGR